MTFCSNFVSSEDSAIEGGGECNIPDLTPFALNVYDIYIVINHGLELQQKSPPWIILFMFQRLNSLLMVFCASRNIIILNMM